MFMVLQAGVGARWFPIATQPIILLCYAKMINNSNGSALQQWLKDTRRSLNEKIKGLSVVEETNGFHSAFNENDLVDEEDVLSKFRLKHMISECSDTQTVEAKAMLDGWSTAIEVEEIRDDRRWLHKIEKELKRFNSEPPVKVDDLVKRIRSQRTSTGTSARPVMKSVNDLFGQSADTEKIKESISKCDETMEKAKQLLAQTSASLIEKTLPLKPSIPVMPSPLDSIYKQVERKSCKSLPPSAPVTSDPSLKSPSDGKSDNNKSNEQIKLEMERNSKRQQRLLKLEAEIEERRRLERLKLLHKCVLGWKMQSAAYQTKLKSILIGRRWQTINRLFHSWQKTAASKSAERERRLIEAQRVHEQQLQALSELIWTKRTFSDYFHRWQSHWQIKLEERTLTNYRKTRAVKVKQFLNKIANKSETTIDAVVPTGTEPIKEAHSPINDQIISASFTHGKVTTKVPTKSSPSSTNNNRPIIKRTKKDEVFIKAMQQREEERKARKAEAEQRKLERQREAEQRRQEEERRKRDQEEANRKAELERQQQLRQQHQEEERLKQELKERQTNDMRVAKQHYERRGLLNYRGLCGWRRKLTSICGNELKADQKSDRMVLHKALVEWRRRLTERRLEKDQMADLWFAKHCYRRALDKWQAQFWESRSRAVELTVQLRKFVQKRALKSMKSAYRGRLEACMERERKLEQRASGFVEKHLMNSHLMLWRRLYRQQKEAKWRQYRAERLRERAKELLVHSRLQAPLTDRLSFLSGEFI